MCKIAGRMFDHIIIRQEKHLRGRTAEINIITRGYQSLADPLLTKSFPKKLKPKHAINSAEEGSITALSDVVTNAIEIVQEYLDKENENGEL
jgi:cyanophycin synthetase